MEHRVLPSLNSGVEGMGIDKYAFMLSVLMFLMIWKLTFCNFLESGLLGFSVYVVWVARKYYQQAVLGFIKSQFGFRNYYDAGK